jgi:hypothetical protein
MLVKKVVWGIILPHFNISVFIIVLSIFTVTLVIFIRSGFRVNLFSMGATPIPIGTILFVFFQLNFGISELVLHLKQRQVRIVESIHLSNIVGICVVPTDA